jgi:hypothetical protein
MADAVSIIVICTWLVGRPAGRPYVFRVFRVFRGLKVFFTTRGKYICVKIQEL